MPKPAFDPNQPYEAVDSKPPFDPNQPYEAAGTQASPADVKAPRAQGVGSQKYPNMASFLMGVAGSEPEALMKIPTSFDEVQRNFQDRQDENPNPGKLDMTAPAMVPASALPAAFVNAANAVQASRLGRIGTAGVIGGGQAAMNPEEGESRVDAGLRGGLTAAGIATGLEAVTPLVVGAAKGVGKLYSGAKKAMGIATDPMAANTSLGNEITAASKTIASDNRAVKPEQLYPQMEGKMVTINPRKLLGTNVESDMIEYLQGQGIGVKQETIPGLVTAGGEATGRTSFSMPNEVKLPVRMVQAAKEATGEGAVFSQSQSLTDPLHKAKVAANAEANRYLNDAINSVVPEAEDINAQLAFRTKVSKLGMKAAKNPSAMVSSNMGKEALAQGLTEESGVPLKQTLEDYLTAKQLTQAPVKTSVKKLIGSPLQQLISGKDAPSTLMAPYLSTRKK